MYTLFNTKAIWPTSPAPTNQVYYSQFPTTPVYVSIPPTARHTSQSMYFQYPPAWYLPTEPVMSSRPRMASDDVFFPDGEYAYEAPSYDYVLSTPLPQATSYFDNAYSQTAMNVGSAECLALESRNADCHYVDPSFESHPSSHNCSPHTSTDNISYQTASPEGRCKGGSKKLGHSLETASNVSSNSNTSSPQSQPRDDSLINNVLSSSLYVALNEDPPEPATRDKPLKTSSPISQKGTEGKALLIDINNLRKRRGRFITSSSSEKCPRFSENGVMEDLDQCDKILMQARTNNAAEEHAKRREEFLLILEAERERQRKLVLPKHAPKMSCKFCKNNGESEDVYTKHRLHYNEKTVCPLLRHYVCRLCNSTGDFAHTIRHCPFNDRNDKLAWKATFLL